VHLFQLPYLKFTPGRQAAGIRSIPRKAAISRPETTSHLGRSKTLGVTVAGRAVKPIDFAAIKNQVRAWSSPAAILFIP
jgi:hypothetical protein